MAVTLRDVAARAGVSMATASRVLNGSERVPRSDYALRVRTAADELGYVANAQAQALASAATHLVGLCVPNVTDPWFASIVSGVELAVRGKGKQLLVACSEGSTDREDAALSQFVALRADTAILATVNRQSATHLKAPFHNGFGHRLVVIGDSRVKQVSSVEPDEWASAGALADALVRDGHRRFGVISGPSEDSRTAARRDGFIRGLSAHGLTSMVEVCDVTTFSGGFMAGQRMTKAVAIGSRSGDVATAPCVFAVNDAMALGALEAWRRTGLRVPRDLCICGFGGTEVTRRLHPSLTTVAVQGEAIGATAVKTAFSFEAPPSKLKIMGEVFLAETTDLRC